MGRTQLATPRVGAANRAANGAAYAAIDFGTSNSAVALPAAEGASGAQTAHGAAVRLVELEPGFVTMPTAVFYRADTPPNEREAERHYGRAAVAAYVEGQDGRLMRSMKSILGSTLLEQSTDIGGGRSVRYHDVVVGYLRHLRGLAQAAANAPIERVVLGRPVFFVDDDAPRDAAAQAALERAARQAGFAEVHFQYEPIAAALDLESRATREQLVLVADIGGGTSDFSLVRIGPARRGRLDRRDDILASHGVHVAGTDFDRRVELASILPLAGYGALRPPDPKRPGEAAREVPSGIYFDLATWHLINTLYSPARLAELRTMKGWYADARHYQRLLAVLTRRLGHALAAAAEAAKIALAEAGHTRIDLGQWEPGLAAAFDETAAAGALDADFAQIVGAAHETVRQAGATAEAVDAIYFTGGSTGLAPLVERIAAGFSRAERVRGDRFSSVAQGLGWHARALFGAPAKAAAHPAG
ncbi:MAG: Hsp70 family protein [Burkholderiales bacterium]|nr:Hsp70 family protein [Burkholderiales bacterium]